MKKSKSWLKSLLIVVMAMMLVFSLVACNKPGDDAGNNDDDDNPTLPPPSVVQETASEYFTTLWNATKPIGATPIQDNADISVSLGMELSIDTIKDVGGDDVYQQIDLGFDIQLVLGRTEETSKNTALKLRLYDPTDENNAEIITIYVFANDIDNLYIDFAGKNVKMPHDMASLIWGEILGHTEEDDDLGSNIVNGLNNKFIEIGGEKTSINDIINQFIGDFGTDWSLNYVIDKVLKMFNLNVVELIDGLDDGLKTAIFSLLGVSSADDLLDNGNINLLKILSSNAINLLFSATKTETDDAVTHRATVDGNTLKMFASEIASLIYDSNQNGELSLLFTENSDGDLQDFSIYAQLASMKTRISTANGNFNIIPEVTLKITQLSIETLTPDNGVQLKTSKDKYTEEIAFNEQIVLGANGISIEEIAGLTEETIYLNGEIVVNVTGMLDIVNKESNKTQVYATVSLVNQDEEPVTLAELSYANGKIVAKLATAIETETYGTVKGFVYDLGDEFNLATFVQDNVKELIYTFFPSLRPLPEINPGEENGEAAPSATTNLGDMVKKIVATVNAALPLVSTDNNIEVTTTNILKTVIAFKEAINPGTKVTDKNPNPENPVWTEANRISAITNALINPPLDDDATIDDCIQMIFDEFEKIVASIKNSEVLPEENEGTDADTAVVLEEGDEDAAPSDPEDGDEVTDTEESDSIDWTAVKESLGTIKNAVLRMLYICAQSVRIEGVETNPDNFDDDVYADIEKNDGTELTDIEKIYINNILAVLGAEITFKGDLQSGIHAGISVNIADATLYATHSFELIDVTESTFTDLYKDYVDDTDQDQWVILGSEDEE